MLRHTPPYTRCNSVLRTFFTDTITFIWKAISMLWLTVPCSVVTSHTSHSYENLEKSFSLCGKMRRMQTAYTLYSYLSILFYSFFTQSYRLIYIPYFPISWQRMQSAPVKSKTRQDILACRTRPVRYLYNACCSFHLLIYIFSSSLYIKREHWWCALLMRCLSSL